MALNCANITCPPPLGGILLDQLLVQPLIGILYPLLNIGGGLPLRLDPLPLPFRNGDQRGLGYNRFITGGITICIFWMPWMCWMSWISWAGWWLPLGIASIAPHLLRVLIPAISSLVSVHRPVQISIQYILPVFYSWNYIYIFLYRFVFFYQSVQLNNNYFAELPVLSNISIFLRIIQQCPRYSNINNISDIGNIDLYTQYTCGCNYLYLILRELLQNRWLVNLLIIIYLILQFLNQLNYLLNSININNYFIILLYRPLNLFPDKYQYRFAGKLY